MTTKRFSIKLVSLFLVLILTLITVVPAFADTIYTVQPGDTLYRISVRFGVTVDAIRRTNNISGNIIYVGQRLTIPGVSAPTVPTTSTPVPSTGTGSYTVVRGDTLWAIANRFKITVAALQSANRLTNAYIYAGQVLTIPGQVVQQPPFTGTPKINSFSSDLLNVELGGAVVFSWNAVGAKALLCVDARMSTTPCQEVPLVGSSSVRFNNTPAPASQMQIQLQVYPNANTTGTPVISNITVGVNCSAKWYFTNSPAECSSIIANKWVVMQPFEHGYMFWFQDYGETFVLTDNGAELKPYAEVRDTSNRTYPDSDPSIVPPANLFQPVRGFGKFWRGAVPNYGWVRQQLGWATGVEKGYSAFYQCNSAIEDAARCYLSLPDGRVLQWTLNNNLVWRVFPTAQVSNAVPKLPGKFLCATLGGKEFTITKADMTGVVKRVLNFSSFMGFAFSPDGKQVVFSANEGLSNDQEVYIANADGTGNVTKLTDNIFGDIQPAWSADGKRIAFASQRNGQNGLYIMNADGSNQTFIANTNGDDHDPSFSADGLKLAFYSFQPSSGKNAIFTINIDGSNRTQLTDGDDINPVWSPDGKRIVFESHRDDTGPGGSSYEIYVVNADGKGLTRLTNNKAVDYLPVWSPDSQWVAYSSLDNGGLTYALKADGSGQTLRLDENNICNDKAWGV